MFCNPSNPTGIVHTRDELDAVAAMLADTDTLLLSDEAYSDLVYTDTPFVSALDLPALAERTLYCQTFSKAYAMTGWRLGYLAGNPDVIAAAARVHALTAGPLNPATQRAALIAVHEPPAELTTMREHYLARRDLMIAGLDGRPRPRPRRTGRGVLRLPPLHSQAARRRDGRSPAQPRRGRPPGQRVRRCR